MVACVPLLCWDQPCILVFRILNRGFSVDCNLSSFLWMKEVYKYLLIFTHSVLMYRCSGRHKILCRMRPWRRHCRGGLNTRASLLTWAFCLSAMLAPATITPRIPQKKSMHTMMSILPMRVSSRPRSVQVRTLCRAAACAQRMLGAVCWCNCLHHAFQSHLTLLVNTWCVGSPLDHLLDATRELIWMNQETRCQHRSCSEKLLWTSCRFLPKYPEGGSSTGSLQACPGRCHGA